MSHYWHSSLGVYIAIVLITLVGYTSVFFYTLSIAHTQGTSTTHFLTFSEGDAHEYYVLGHMLRDTGRFSLSVTSPPEYFRTPAYPFFIASLLAITNNDLAIPFAQIILVALSALCIYTLGKRFFTYEVGIVTAVLYLINPMTITQSFRTTTETAFVLVLLSVTVVLMRMELSSRLVAAGGMLLGLLALVRPIGLLVIPLFLLWIIFVQWARWHVLLKQVALFICSVAIILVPWFYRNYAYGQHFALSSIGPYNILFYNVLEFEHQRTGISKDILRGQMIQRIGSSYTDPQFRSFVYTNAEQEAIKEYIGPRLLQYGLFHAYSTVPFFFGSDFADAKRSLYLQGVLSGNLPVDSNLSALLRQGNFGAFMSAIREDPLALAERVVWVVISLSALGIVWVSVVRKFSNAALLLFIFMLPLLLAFLTGPVASPRYRMPAAPFLTMLGVAGILHFTAFLKNGRIRRSTEMPIA